MPKTGEILALALASVAFAAGVVMAEPASAQLALTPAGVADGFTLSTFFTPSPGSNPFGLAVDSAGNVFVDTDKGTQYVFPDVDGNTPATAIYTQSFSSNGGAYTYDSFTGTVYGAVLGGNYVSFNPNGTVANSDVFPRLAGKADHGMWTNPVTGDILSDSSLGLIDINPTTGDFFGITSKLGDGVSVSPNGKIVFADEGQYYGYTDTPGAPVVFHSGQAFPSPDGSAEISGGQFSGDLVVNDNDGDVYLLTIDECAGGIGCPTSDTMIASGGTQGDYVQADWTNGSLLLDYSNMVARLSCPGCSFGLVAGDSTALTAFLPGAPEPSCWTMMLVGFAGLGFLGCVRTLNGRAATA